MDSIISAIQEWIKEMLVGGIMSNLSGMFDAVNQQVAEIAGDVGTTPANFSPGVYSMIRNISESVIIPIAGLILTFIACYELIQAGTAVDASTLEAMEETLRGMDIGPLLGLFLQSIIVQITMYALSIVIFIIVYGRMVEIYLLTSLAPIPFATFGNREQSQIGQNYLRSLLALGFQGFLIMICVGIYAVLIQSIAFSDNIISSIWGAMGYTVLLVFTLFKTGAIARSVFNAH